MENNQNAFEQLAQENEAQYQEHKLGIYNNVSSRRNNWSFIGDILELYIPKIVAVFLGNVGDKKKN